MKTGISLVLTTLLAIGTALAQDVPQKEAVKTTKIAKSTAKELKKDAKKAGDEEQVDVANQTKKAAKGAKRQAKKNN